MKKVTKRMILLFTVLCMCINLCACGMIGAFNEVNAFDAELLVQGNLDEIFLGKADPNYLELVDSTREESKELYMEGLEAEAEFFATYWGILDTNFGQTYDDLDADLKEAIIDLYEEIYSYSKYEVISSVKQDDGSFAVKVTVDPIDVMQRASDAYENYEPLITFLASYDQAAIDAMNDEEYLAFNCEYGRIIVQMVSEQIPNLDYMDQKTQTIQVEEDSDGYFAINDDDLMTFDSYVIFYP